jgi:hypothetical protein
MAGPASDPLTERRPGLSLPIEITAITAILALALGLMAGAGAALYQRSRPTVYTSSSVLLIDQPISVAEAPDAGPLLKLQQLRYLYASLVRTDVIARPVSQQLNIPEGVVENDLVGFVNPTTYTINLFATTASPSESSQLAQAATAQLISYVQNQQAHIDVAQLNRIVLTEATMPRQGIKITPSTTKVLLPGVIAFIVVAGAFLIVADLLRRRW